MRLCPWCYRGKRRLERALEDFDHRAAVSIARTSASSDRCSFFVIDDRYGISGAQPIAIFRQALAQAWANRVTAS
jgi:predicted DsbA family dithiol-disulfide isomerase